MPLIKGPAGIEWNYDCDGEGKTMVLFHGWGVDKRMWRQQIKHFQQQYHVISIDLPGHGQTTWVDLSFEEMCADLSKVLVQLAPGKITTLSSSMGGLFALKLYDGMPEKVERMVFCGSLPKFAKSKDFPYGLNVNRMRMLAKQLEMGYPFIVDIFFRSLFTKEERKTRRYKWLQKFRKFNAKPMKKALANYLTVLEEVDLRHVLQQAAIPIQYINGDGDEICSKQCVQTIEVLKPEARFDYFPECGHFPFLSKPYEFNRIVDEFLNETQALCS